MLITLAHDGGPRRFGLEPTGFDRLTGWRQDHVSEAVPVFLKSCLRFLSRSDSALLDPLATNTDFGQVGEWRPLCDTAANLPSGDDESARHFFETGFIPFLVTDYAKPEGLFTGYYEIELKGSRWRHGRYQIPLYRKPPDIGSHRPNRAEIEDGALAERGLELFWVDDPIDAFFLQIQGSGRVRLSKKRVARVGTTARTANLTCL